MSGFHMLHRAEDIFLFYVVWMELNLSAFLKMQSLYLNLAEEVLELDAMLQIATVL
jgi:hypothetical protein